MKVLMVGLGSIARKHIAALRQIDPAVQLVAWRSSRSGASVEGVADVYSLPVGETFDFAIVSNPTSCHANTVRELLALNIPLFIEKPLFSSLGQEKLLEEIRRRGVLTYVACNMRFMDTLQYLHAHVGELKVNEVNVYCGSYLPDWRPGTDWRGSYSARPELGGGVHLDLIHELDYVCWIFGRPDSCHKRLRSRSTLGIPAVDYANYCLEYPHFAVSVVLNYYRKDYKRTMEIVADGTTWTANLENGDITDETGRVLFRTAQKPNEDYLAQMRWFVSMVEARSTHCDNDVFEAYEVLKLCLE